MKSYLELKQYKWIIMLMAQFGFKIWWQALFLGDCCSRRLAMAANVHHISLEISDAGRPQNNNVCNCTLFFRVCCSEKRNIFAALFLYTCSSEVSFFHFNLIVAGERLGALVLTSLLSDATVFVLLSLKPAFQLASLYLLQLPSASPSLTLLPFVFNVFL